MKITFSCREEEAAPHGQRGGGIQPLHQPSWPLVWQPRGPTQTRGVRRRGVHRRGVSWGVGAGDVRVQVQAAGLDPGTPTLLSAVGRMLPVVPCAIPCASLRDQMLGGKLRVLGLLGAALKSGLSTSTGLSQTFLPWPCLWHPLLRDEKIRKRPDEASLTRCCPPVPPS